MTISLNSIYRQLEKNGYRAKAVKIERLGELQNAIQDFYVQGLFDPDFYQEWLTGFDFVTNQARFQPKSIFVIAVPQPQFQVTFSLKGISRSWIVPPTYLNNKKLGQQVTSVLTELLGPQGYQVAIANLPNKLTAVRSGLGRYGKNNLCYIEGFGSFHRLFVRFSDFPCLQDDWQPVQMMDLCQTCIACQRHCPTGAISADRFLLHAERCLTYWNEKRVDIHFPDWIKTNWHNSLVGCMQCQFTCPVDKDFVDWVEQGPSFSSEETEMLLQGLCYDQLPNITQQKLEQYDLFDVLETLPRNLRALI